jgi:oxygen-independent coproporphyrinogen-3 oxidase
VFSRLYLHIPWCLSKCGYCAFNSQPLEPEKLEQTCTLLLREMELAAKSYPLNQPLHSLYFGGGTPSLLDPEQISRLISRSRELFGHTSSIEITLEANPGTVSSHSLAGYYQAGVTRLSLGAQSFNGRCCKPWADDTPQPTPAAPSSWHSKPVSAASALI